MKKHTTFCDKCNKEFIRGPYLGSLPAPLGEAVFYIRIHNRYDVCLPCAKKMLKTVFSKEYWALVDSGISEWPNPLV